ncbi:MAG: hypothetical protein ACLS8T_35840 [Anaerobutyricum sp.]
MRNGKSKYTDRMMISRQAQEVQGAMVTAKRFPRDEVESQTDYESCKGNFRERNV